MKSKAIFWVGLLVDLRCELNVTKTSNEIFFSNTWIEMRCGREKPDVELPVIFFFFVCYDIDKSPRPPSRYMKAKGEKKEPSSGPRQHRTNARTT